MNTPNIPLTAFHTPNTPMTPNTQGALYGAKPRTGTSKFLFKGKKQQQNANINAKESAPAKSWAQVATLNIPQEVMQEKDHGKYVERLMAVNIIKPNHVITPEASIKPKPAADMEKIASVIGIKNIT